MTAKQKENNLKSTRIGKVVEHQESLPFGVVELMETLVMSVPGIRSSKRRSPSG
jgi:hypothetical protein